MVDGWSRFSTEPMLYEELDVYVDKYPHHNVGLVLGQVVCALDIDTDNPDVIAAAPKTPIVRYGRRGVVLFYKANFMPTEKASDVPIDFLNRGCQVIVHGRHPKGMMYKLEQNAPWDELPSITPDDLKRVQNACRKAGVLREVKLVNGEMVGTGRNNQLTNMAWAKANEGVPLEQAVDELLNCEAGSWFRDPSEPHRGKNPRESAEKMYKKALDKVGDVPVQELVIDLKPKPPQPTAPKPRGLIKLFQDYCNATAFGNQDALGIGGGLALMSTLTSNKFFTRAGAFDVWANLYIMNIAHSGFGKETPQRALDELFAGTDLIGSATYKSGSSIIMNLPEQPVRLDLIDECAMLLKAMASKEDYKADIVDVLSTLYSKSSGYFAGFTSKGDGKNFGACWNPCVNILGSTTPAGFKGAVSKDMAAKGLLPRFLTFWQKEVGNFKRGQDPKVSDSILREIRRIIQSSFLAEEYNVVDESMQGMLVDLTKATKEAEKVLRFYPELVPMNKAAQDMIMDIQEQYFNEGKNDPDSFESAFKNRFAQHTAKIALSDALGLGLREITLDSIDWAHSLVKWQWSEARELYELASASNDHAKDVMRIHQYIKNKGPVTKNKITRAFQDIQWQRLEGILKQLEDGDSVHCATKVDEKKPGKKAKVYVCT